MMVEKALYAILTLVESEKRFAMILDATFYTLSIK